ncbi:hypothetical protein [Streptomyces sp. NPDC001759]
MADCNASFSGSDVARDLGEEHAALEGSKEQIGQEAPSNDRQGLNGGVRLHHVQHRRAKNDASHDLEDRARGRDAGHQGEEEGDAVGYRENDD